MVVIFFPVFFAVSIFCSYTARVLLTFSRISFLLSTSLCESPSFRERLSASRSTCLCFAYSSASCSLCFLQVLKSHNGCTPLYMLFCRFCLCSRTITLLFKKLFFCFQLFMIFPALRHILCEPA